MNRAWAPSAVALVVLLAAPTTATAKLASITGKLSKPGYTVIAMADSGRARTVRVKHASFKLRPPAATVTLHLRAPDGTYAGPVVVGSEKHGKRAILGVKAGTKLRQMTVKGAAGFAKARPAVTSIDLKRQARAKHGIPIGAGNVGLVRSRRAHGPGSDPDLDGVPNPIDVDDDGDLILDDYDRSTNARATQSGVGGTFPDGSWMRLSTTLLSLPNEALNVNGGASDEQIAAAQQRFGLLSVFWIGIDPGSGELDCGALIYCSAGGSGGLTDPANPSRENAEPFPECCDSDEDGFGSLTPTMTGPVDLMYLYHGATADQIRTGDVLIERAKVGHRPLESASSVGFVFSTVPSVAIYSDGQGNSRAFTYPYSGGSVPVGAGPSGDVVLTLTFWRPQRQRTEGDPGEGRWIDIGNLEYIAGVALGGSGGSCPQSDFLSADPSLTPLQSSPAPGGWPDAGGFADQRGDQPSNPANTFTYTLNLTDCLESKGLSMSLSEPTLVNFTAFAVGAGITQPAFAVSSLSVQLQP